MNNRITKTLLYSLVTILVFGLFSKVRAQSTNQQRTDKTISAPDSIWKEHWFEHNKTLKFVGGNRDVAAFYDENMPPEVQWPIAIMGKCWAYVKRNYGDFGQDPRLYVILHRSSGKDYAGGHPSPFFDKSHDYRNVIDCGLQQWDNPTGEQIGMPIHEMGHIVTSASHASKGSPSDALWGDSKFMEIFNYDVLLNIGMEKEAQKVHIQMQTQYDDFPRSGTQWFKNWFFPIYDRHGQGKVLNKYFELLALNFPKNRNGRFMRDINFGEFVHFWSGAAGTDLKDTAEKAFGWSPEYELQLRQAQKDFPTLHYKMGALGK